MRMKAVAFLPSIMASQFDKKPNQYWEEMSPYKPRQPVHPKGHKPFLIEGIEIWALNGKNAKKKFKNQDHGTI